MNRERVTISIKKDLLDMVDHKVDGVRLRNRSHAIESLLASAMGMGGIKDAIIMAGGEDVMSYIGAIKESLVSLKKIGIDEIIVAVGYLGDKIKKELKDGKEFGVNISYLENAEGSGGVLHLLRNALKKSFIVINVNEKLDVDLKNLVDFHRNSNSYVTLATSDIKTYKGIYIIEPEVMKYVPKGFSLLEEDIFPKLLNEHKLTIYPVI